VSESSDWLRDLVSTIVETNLSLRDYRQNQVVKKVSSWAAIIAVPALITGYYGMNVPYPRIPAGVGRERLHRLDHRGTIALYRLFRRIDWL
jgi:magnesium transporter